MRKEKEGKVISDRMESTAIVEVQALVSHPVYKRIIKRKKKFAAHNPENKAKIGDRVRMVETRPLSKTKRWRVVEILGEKHGESVSSSKAKATTRIRKKKVSRKKEQ